jgi:hypothetical protein
MRIVKKTPSLGGKTVVTLCRLSVPLLEKPSLTHDFAGETVEDQSMKVFIGSSYEARQEMRKVARWIEDDNHQALSWDDPGVFMPGDQLFTKLRKISQQVDAAIFIFSEDDKVWYREDMTTQPRDNILLEFGLFAGQLSAERTIICKKKQSEATHRFGRHRVRGLEQAERCSDSHPRMDRRSPDRSYATNIEDFSLERKLLPSVRNHSS